MRPLNCVRAIVRLFALFLLLAPIAMFAGVHTVAAPEARVVARVDNTRRVALRGHLSAALHKATDMGRLAPSTPAQHLYMVLKSSPEQERELRRIVDEQQDKSTGNFHQWMTPEEFGQTFGVHDADIQKVTGWLASQGFSVESISKSKRVIQFSGKTGQLENAFQTEMHSYQLNGETHVSNNSEITVPEALSPVISGVTLHNFFRKGHMGPVQKLSDLRKGPQYGPGGNSGAYVGPADFATIYNTAPLLQAGINGTGSSIAIVGRSDILMSDVQSYRQLFNLPPNDPTFVHAGQDNGVEPGDDGESDLDVEISGGIAPNAKVYFVIGTPTFLVDGITNSIEYIVENNLADIMSISYGSCEVVEGAGGNSFNNQAFEQAAAQGISVFVASGDNGPAQCDDSNDAREVLGYATGAEASTPYSVSVGGAQFDDSASADPTYWSSTTNSLYLNSALSYIPEYPWNEGKGADKSLSPAADLAGLWSGSGGISAYYLQPSWQSGPGVPLTDPTLTGGNWVASVTITNAGSGYTATPTVTFGAGCAATPAATSTMSGGSVTAVNFNYGTQGGTLANGQGFNCSTVPTITFTAAPAGGTTATATAVLGPMQDPPPLISGVPHRYTPDLALNAAADHEGTLFCSEGVCEISSTGALVDAGIVGGTSVAAPSMAGIQALIDQANGGRQGMPGYIYYSLAAAQNTAGCNSSTPPAPGSNCAFQDITQGDNLICGLATCTSATPAAKIGFTAGVGYDMASGLGSVNAANLSNQWKNVVFNSSNTTLSLGQNSGSGHGSAVTLSGTVAPGSGSGTPTGDVAFIVSQGAITQTINTDTGAFNGAVAFATLSGGSYSVDLSTLPAGTYNVTARYGGDATFASSLSSPVQITINSESSTVTLIPQFINQSTCIINTTTTFTYGQLAWIQAAVVGASGQGVPTGTVTITVDGSNYATETLDPNGNGYLVAGALGTTATSCLYDYLFAQSPTLTGGAHTIGASYSGDSTFGAMTATPVNITVSQLTATPTLAAGATLITSGTADQLTATFATITALSGNSGGSAGPTGTMTFTDTTTATVLGTAPVVPSVTYSGNSYTYAGTALLNTTGITTTGANAITASYSGDSNYAATTSAAATVTVSTGTATTTTITSSANPTTLNGRPTFTATVAGGAGPTAGTVTFYDGTTVLGTGTVGAAHTTTFRPASGGVFLGGAHNLTASFGGNATFMASTSPVFVENVTQGTNTISLTVKTADVSGQAYVFAAVLTPSNTNATFAPNRSSVQFLDGATNIGSAVPITVTSAQGGYGLWTATLTVNGLSIGAHSITATYSDVDYAAATSNIQTVYVGSSGTSLGIYTPVSGTTLTGSSATFKWFPVAGASYWIDIGSAQGGNSIYQSGNLGSPLSLTVTTLPTDGSTVWVRLWYLINGTWSFTDGSYTAFSTASPAPATMATPINGSPLSGTSQAFTWNASSSATNYWLDIGNVAGGNQYYQSGSLPSTQLTTTASNLPSDGSQLFVTLYSKINGNWVSNAYTYTAYSAAAGKGTMATPINGSPLTSTSVTFNWNAGSAATAYWLDAGNVVGGNQYYQSGNLGSSLSTTATGLPTDGSMVYVRLYSLISGTWLSNDYTYTALSYTKAAITNPTPTSVLTSNSVNFQWNTGSGASAYWIDVGSSLGGNQFYQSGSLPTSTTSATVSGLPTDGSTIYVRLYTQLNGNWVSNDYTFVAETTGPATISSPTNGTMISGGSATFTWALAQGASAYWVDIGTVPGGNQIYQSGNLGNVNSAPVSGLPTDGSTIYVTLYSYINGSWVSTSASYTTGP